MDYIDIVFDGRQAPKVPDSLKWKTPVEGASISAKGCGGLMDIGHFAFLRMHGRLDGKVVLEDELQRIYDSACDVTMAAAAAEAKAQYSAIVLGATGNVGGRIVQLRVQRASLQGASAGVKSLLG